MVYLIISSIRLLADTISVEAISENIKSTVDTKVKSSYKEIIKSLYTSNNFQPFWVGGNNDKKLSQLINALNDPLYNYKEKDMGRKNLKQLFFLLDNNQIDTQKKTEVYARLDLLLTNSFVSLVDFIVVGDVDWNLVKRKMEALKSSDDIAAKWEFTSKSFPDRTKLYQAASGSDIIPYLNSLIPMENRYRKLVDILKDYKTMEKFPQIDYTNEVYQLGDSDGDIKDIKMRLQISGDFPKNGEISRKFDQDLYNAVIKYQKRYNLEVSGKIDKVMVYYLNLPIKANIQQTIVNLDKCKLYPKSYENEYVEVNIPDFNLRYYRNGSLLYKSGVVVGRIDRPTPIFDHHITQMVLNPTWTIPDNLIKRDLIKAIKEHPEYLKEKNIHAYLGDKEVDISSSDLEGYEVGSSKKVPYRFVQFPGDDNALGRIKFVFPNKYDVYLHDTDNKSLLEHRYKIYSSGCMRLDKPFDLMNILLSRTNGSYSQSKIDQILATMQPTTISLSNPIPIHLVYFTVYKEDGLAYFRNDIYLYDKMIWESSAGQKKSYFKLPSKRFIDVNRNGQSTQDEPKKKGLIQSLMDSF